MCYTDKAPVQISLVVQLLVFFLHIQIYNLDINKCLYDLQLSPGPQRNEEAGKCFALVSTMGRLTKSDNNMFT